MTFEPPESFDEQAVQRALAELRADLAARIEVPPFSTLERRARIRRASRTAGMAAAIAAVAAVAAVLVPRLASGPDSTATVARPPQVTVTVTVPPPPLTALGPISLDDVSFASPTDGVVLGTRCNNAHVCDTVVRRSTDGGVSFEPAALVAPAQGVANKIADLGDGYVYAYGPGLFLSADDGASWHRVDVGGRTVRDIAAGSDGTLVVLTTADHGPARLLRLPLGDVAAEPVAMTQVPDTGTQARLQQPTAGVEIVVGSGANAHIMEQTRAAGWTRRNLPPQCAYPSLSTTPTTWWVACAAGHGKAVTTRVWRSVGGGNWVRLPDPPKSAGTLTITAVSPTTAYLSGLGLGLDSYADASGRWVSEVPSNEAIGEPHFRGGQAWVTAGQDVFRRVGDRWIPTSLR